MPVRLDFYIAHSSKPKMRVRIQSIMKQPIFFLLIMIFSACQSKKAGPETEGTAVLTVYDPSRLSKSGTGFLAVFTQNPITWEITGLSTLELPQETAARK